MSKKVLLAVALAGMLLGCASSARRAGKIPADKGQPPIIVDFFASDHINAGQSWRVYLHATDPDEDMDYIAAILSHPGAGIYPTSMTWLKNDNRGGFSGYLYLKTPPDLNFINPVSKMTMTLLIRDQQGNRSDKIELAFRIDGVSKKEPPEKWRDAANNPLGSIYVVFMRPEQFKSGE